MVENTGYGKIQKILNSNIDPDIEQQKASLKIYLLRTSHSAQWCLSGHSTEG